MRRTREGLKKGEQEGWNTGAAGKRRLEEGKARKVVYRCGGQEKETGENGVDGNEEDCAETSRETVPSDDKNARANPPMKSDQEGMQSNRRKMAARTT